MRAHLSSTSATTSSFTSRTRTPTLLGKIDGLISIMTSRIAIGPLNFIKQESEQIVKPATDMIKLPPNHYCIIKNPIVRDEEGNVVSYCYLSK
jgi:hypothetical protein